MTQAGKPAQGKTPTRKSTARKPARKASSTSPLHLPILTEYPQLLDPASEWIGHLPFAFWLVDAVRPKHFIEIGSYSGVSYCGFCQAIAKLELDCSAHAIGSRTVQAQPAPTSPSEGETNIQPTATAHSHPDDQFQTLRAHHDRRYGYFSELIVSPYDEAATKFADKSIDLLHIDGQRTLDATRSTFAIWLPKLSTRAVVLVHDTNVYEQDSGVQTFWREVSEQYPSFEFLHGRGLGVLSVGSRPGSLIKWLTDLTDETAHGVREEFCRLAQPLQSHVDLVAQNSRMSEEVTRVEVEKLAVQDQLLTVHNELLELRAAHKDTSSAHQQLRAERQEWRDANAELKAAYDQVLELNDELTAALGKDEETDLALTRERTVVASAAGWRDSAAVRKALAMGSSVLSSIRTRLR